MDSIPPQQASLLGEPILKSKNVKALGIVTQSLNEGDAKRKGRGKKRGRHNNVQQIREIRSKLVASGQYPTVAASFSSCAKSLENVNPLMEH